MTVQLTAHAALLQYASEHTDANRVIANFCGSNPDTIRRWRAGNMPKGKYALSLQAFLRDNGYALDAPMGDDPAVRYLADLVAFQVLTPREVLDLLDLEGDESYVWHVFRGDIMPLSIKSGKITRETLDEMFRAELATQRSALLPAGAPGSQPQPTLPPDQPTSVQPCSELSGPETDLFVVETSSRLLACLPYLRRLSATNDPEVGSQVRELMGAENFFDMLDVLKGMSSRQAGKFFQPQS